VNKSFKILTFDNKVGLMTDAMLLSDLLNTIHNIECDISLVNTLTYNDVADVGIWIQDFDRSMLGNFKKNIFYINEEWFHNSISDLNEFDFVICKNGFAKELLIDIPNVIQLPFISKDMYDPAVNPTRTYLHFAGRAIQKNTESVFQNVHEITLIDPDDKWNAKFDITSNINHVNTYESDEFIRTTLNSHSAHICCSLYESWGHYLFEGLSTGAEIICSDIPVFREHLDPDLVHFIPTEHRIDPDYWYCSDNIDTLYPLRHAFFIDESEFNSKLEEFSPIGKETARRQMFRRIIANNKLTMITFFDSI
jgi:glycosyltransferase involved in cell wall biosynthesis